MYLNHHRSSSEQVLQLPKLLPKVKIGPTTRISPPLSFRSSNCLLSRSSLETHGAITSISKPVQSFLDQLIEKYTSTRNTDSIDLTSQVQRVETQTFSWSMKKTYGNIPSSRVSSTLTQVGSEFFLFGGQAGDRLNELRRFNYEKLFWKPVKTFKDLEAPEPRDGHSTSAYKNSLVVYGGAGAYNPVLHTRTCSPLVHLLDLQTFNWKVVRPEGRVSDPRRNHSAVVVGSSMVVYGGINNNSDTLSDLHLLNLELMQWVPVKLKKKSARLGFRHSFTMTAVFHWNALKNTSSEIYNIPGVFDEEFSKKNTGIYVFGGMNDTGKVLNDLILIQAIKRVARTDKNLLKITKVEGLGNSPIARYGHSAGLCGKFLIVVGGRNDSLYSGSSQASVGEVAAFNITTSRWEIVELSGTIPPSFWGIASSSFGSKLICFGGMNLNSFASNDIWVLETNQENPFNTNDKRKEQPRRNALKKGSVKML